MTEPSAASSLSPDVLPTVLMRAVAAAAQGVTIADALAPDVPLVYANAAFERMTGYPLDEVIGRNCRFLQGPDTDPTAPQAIRQAMAAGREIQIVLLNQRKDGTTFWNDLGISPVRDDDGRITHFIGYQLDVTERVEWEQELTELAHRDALTGLSTRDHLLDQLEELLADAGDDQAVAVLTIDLAGFSEINETFGYDVGNVVLRGVADRLATVTGPDDLLAHGDADNFLLVRPTTADDAAATAEWLAEQVTEALQGQIPTPVLPITARAHCGAAVSPTDGTTASALFRAARRTLERRRAEP
ncbi:GGDEF domain-containing protein [Nakamurella leprariae]|uniref:Diguanylate cyclase n=1 Tax=Nakamurella leprariae TaxID=2803911 RepID=A0A938YGB4_9ACTN|nr:GGDEF domain-containing protein [Nakamurella leprariae]MBM9469369.1 diguanylate cyclase [Nakamurella leprariae]